MLAKEIREKTNEELLAQIDALKDSISASSRLQDSWKTRHV